jgi:DNA-3-methyladenine glycosylase II
LSVLKNPGIPQEAISHLKKDIVLAEIISNTILPENNSEGNVYKDLIKSITSQQLSTTVARVIFNRLCMLYDGMSPTPGQLIDTDHETLRSVGYSNQKARYIKNVALFFEDKNQEFDYWTMIENEKVIEELTSIKGVGKWTVQMILIFTLERPDVFPVDDLGIQMGMKHFYNLNTEKKALMQEMETIADHWRPFRTYASRYIWAAKDKK